MTQQEATKIIEDYYTVIESSGFVLMPIKKGKKIIIVDEEKEV